jgi:protein MAK11
LLKDAKKGSEASMISGLSMRVKDFKVMKSANDFYVPAASSDGTLRVWRLSVEDLKSHTGKAKQVGTLLGTYETSNRITCLEAFVMFPSMEGAEDDDDFEGFGENGDDLAESSSSDSE